MLFFLEIEPIKLAASELAFARVAAPSGKAAKAVTEIINKLGQKPRAAFASALVTAGTVPAIGKPLEDLGNALKPRAQDNRAETNRRPGTRPPDYLEQRE